MKEELTKKEIIECLYKVDFNDSVLNQWIQMINHLYKVNSLQLNITEFNSYIESTITIITKEFTENNLTVRDLLDLQNIRDKTNIAAIFKQGGIFDNSVSRCFETQLTTLENKINVNDILKITK